MLKTKTRVKTTATKAAGDEKGANFQFLFVRQIRHCFNSGREGETGALWLCLSLKRRREKVRERKWESSGSLSAGIAGFTITSQMQSIAKQKERVHWERRSRCVTLDSSSFGLGLLPLSLFFLLLSSFVKHTHRDETYSRKLVVHENAKRVKANDEGNYFTLLVTLLKTKGRNFLSSHEVHEPRVRSVAVSIVIVNLLKRKKIEEAGNESRNRHRLPRLCLCTFWIPATCRYLQFFIHIKTLSIYFDVHI